MAFTSSGTTGHLFRTERIRCAFFYQPLAVALACLVGMASIPLPASGQQMTVYSKFVPDYTPAPADPLGNPTQSHPVSTITPPGTLFLPDLTVTQAIQPNSANHSSFNYRLPTAAGTCPTTNTPNTIVQCIGLYGASFPASWEAAAAQTFVISHGLPASDAAYIYQYGRADLRNQLRGFMLSLLIGLIKKKPANRTADETAVYLWMTQLISNREIASYTAANTEYQSWISNSCNYTVNDTVVNALGLSSNGWIHCGGGSFSISFATPPVPPLAYFEAVGNAAAYTEPLGASGQQALSQAQQEFLHSSLVATQAAGNSNAEYAALVAGAASAGPGLAAYANLNSIAPFRNRIPFQAPKINWASAAETVYQTGSDVAEAGSAAEELAPEVAQEIAAETAAVAEEPAVDAAVAAVDAAGAAAGVASAASAGLAVVGVALFAIEAAVTAGIQAFSNDQNLSDDATLPQLVNQVQNTGQDLNQLVQTSDGFTKICNTFIQATLPDYPSTTAPPTGGASESFYFNRGSGGSGSTTNLAYDNVDGNNWSAYLWNGWVVQKPLTGPQANTGLISFGLDFNYIDQKKVNRRATRISPNLFEIEPQQYDPNAPFCAADSKLGITNSSLINVDLCESAVTNSAKMTEFGGPLTTYIALPPVINTNPTVTAAQGQKFTYQPTLTSLDPLGNIPCSDTISGTLPNNITSTGSGLTSVSPYNYTVGTFPLIVTAKCGASSVSLAVSLVAGTKVAINGSPFFALNQGVPFTRTISTTSSPVAKLTVQGTLPQGVIFKDNGDGTGTFSGTPTALYNSCTYPDCPVLIASDGATYVNGSLDFTVTYTPPVISSPASGSTVQVLTDDSIANDPKNTIAITTGANSGTPKLTALVPQDGTFSFTDHGDGTGSLVVNNPNAVTNSVPVTITATPCCGYAPVSSNFTVQENPAPAGISNISNGPAAFVVGEATPLSLPVTLLINKPDSSAIRPYALQGLPSGLALTNVALNGNSASFLQGPARFGTGGLYHIPLNFYNSSDTTTLDVAIYEAPSFPLYSGIHSVVFRVGTPSTYNIAPISGFPIGPFSDGSLGSSTGISYAVNPSLASGLNNTPFSVHAGSAGVGNGSLTLSYNGVALSSGNQFSLPLNTSVTTGPVPGYMGANDTGGFGTLKYTAKAAFTVNVYVAIPGDADMDGKVTCSDVSLVRGAINQTKGSNYFSNLLDMNNDGKITIQDLFLVTKNLPSGTHCQ